MFRLTRSYRLYFLIAFFFCCPVFFSAVKAQGPVARQGILDLRQADLSRQSIPLNGEWAIYWHKLIPPKDSSSPTAFVPFPKLWQKTTINGLLLPNTGYASYALTVLLPKHSNSLALEIPNTYTSYRLFVNGEEFASSGDPDSVEENSVPKWLEKTVELTKPADTLRLVLHVANYLHSKGGPYRELVIGDKEKLFHKREVDSAFDLVLTGCLFMGGLFFFGLFLFGRHDKSILFFALFAMTYSYRVIGVRLYVLHSIFPNIPWTVTLHLEYLTLFVSIIFFSLYTRHLYPEDSNKYMIWTQVWLCLILSAIVVIFPPGIFTQLINPFLVVMFG
jgi:hypothetical protein